MKILLTGPSCAGKTAVSRLLPADRIIHLDPSRDAGASAEMPPVVPGTGLVVYEGIPVGSDERVRAFLEQIDAVLLLDTGRLRRLLRCWRRDGVGSTARWLYNEWFWWRVCRPLVLGHRNLRYLRWKPLRGATARP